MAPNRHTFTLPTPFGEALCRLDGQAALVELKLVGEDESSEPTTQDVPPAIAQAIAEVRKQLADYFARERREIALRLSPQGTAFQRRVWCELNRIPYGSTISYGELAARVGDVKAVRAVGRANGANPVWIVIPCHRVIGADGSLTGYAGGLDVKRRLLELEGAISGGLF